ncbi:MAG: hypothetical protein ACOC2W_00855 [bacterium]
MAALFIIKKVIVAAKIIINKDIKKEEKDTVAGTCYLHRACSVLFNKYNIINHFSNSFF